MKTLTTWMFAMGLALSSNACDLGPKEGDPCNALLLQDECDDGLHCQTIGSCTTSYCCPTNASSSTKTTCNACPLDTDAGGPDAAGPDAAGTDADAAGTDAGDATPD